MSVSEIYAPIATATALSEEVAIPAAWGWRSTSTRTAPSRRSFEEVPIYRGMTVFCTAESSRHCSTRAMTHCLFHLGVEAVTGTLDVRFVKPVPCDAVLTVRANLTDSHPPLYKLMSVLMWDGHVMARAQAKFMQAKSKDRQTIREN